MLPFVCLVAARIWIESQTPSSSVVCSDRPAWIHVPEHCRVKNYILAAHPHYLIRKATVLKPLRKAFEYEYDIERGIWIGGDLKMQDLSNYPDFSAQALGIGLGGLLIAVLFKLFG